MIAAIDGSQTGDIKTTKWAVKGIEFGFSSPVDRRPAGLSDRQRRRGCAPSTSRRAASCGSSSSARSQKAPPVLADGKIYVGTENGKFFILRPHRRSRRDPEQVELPISTNSVRRIRGHARADSRRAPPSRAAASSSCRATRSTRSVRRRRRAPTGLAVDEPAVEGAGRAGVSFRCRRPS